MEALVAKRTKQLIQIEENPELVRLNKFLSEAGVCSRREADTYIEQGKVTVNGEVAQVGTKVAPSDEVKLLGKTVEKEEKLAFIVLNKPRGIVCTTDQREPDNIIDFVNYKSRIFPIGRLDKDSEGLILLTNDGNIVNKILRAENHHEKEYVVQVNKPITDTFLEKMSAGVPILDTITNPCVVKQEGKDTFRIILTQGLNRQIRRMCEYLGYRVLRLQRVRIMNVTLGRLKEGCYRNVTEREMADMMETIKENIERKKNGEKPAGMVKAAVIKEQKSIKDGRTGVKKPHRQSRTSSASEEKKASFAKKSYAKRSATGERKQSYSKGNISGGSNGYQKARRRVTK